LDSAGKENDGQKKYPIVDLYFGEESVKQYMVKDSDVTTDKQLRELVAAALDNKNPSIDVEKTREDIVQTIQ
jgi:hypothetical protein